MSKAALLKVNNDVTTAKARIFLDTTPHEHVQYVCHFLLNSFPLFIGFIGVIPSHCGSITFQSLYFDMYNMHSCFWPSLSWKKYFILIFNSVIYLFILETCFLYYKGILVFIFEHIMVQGILCTSNKFTIFIYGISTTHV